MRKRHRAFLIIWIIAIAGGVIAQDSHTSKRLILSKGVGTITKRGEIGGESQDKYLLNLEADRKVTIVLYSIQNKANFIVCNERGGFGNSDTCEGAKIIQMKRPGDTNIVRKVRQWIGRIPEAGDYTISVFAHPDSARYELQVKVE